MEIWCWDINIAIMSITVVVFCSGLELHLHYHERHVEYFYLAVNCKRSLNFVYLFITN